MSPTDTRIDNNATFAHIAQLFGPTPAFDPNRSAEEVRAACTHWDEPDAPNEQSHQWYRAATTLNAIKYRTVEQHQQMLMLYEAAARQGHYLAAKNLTILYNQGSLVQHGRFIPEPAKARAWIEFGLDQGWVGTLEWVAVAMIEGEAFLPGGRQKGLAYMQHAANLGVALAQYQLSKLYSGIRDDTAKEEAFIECAAKQRLSAAQQHWGRINLVIHHPQEALYYYQRAVMNGGESGGESAFLLASAFREGSTRSRDLGTSGDEVRRRAYIDLKVALFGDPQSDGNPFMRFPRLNEVLPLPPAEITEWHGIYSAMSPDDAAYYQNPVEPEVYIRDIREAGYLVPEAYVSQPVLDAQ